jgi:O-antigen/teichoic acid export membrane protein
VPAVQGLYFMVGPGLVLSDNTRPLPLMGFAGLVTVICAAFLLVPRFGAAGAAVGTALGWLSMAVVLYAISQRRMAIPYDWPTILGFVVLAGVFAAAGVAAQTLSLWPRLGSLTLLSLAYPLCSVLFLLRSRDERWRVLHFLSKFGLASPSR